MKLGLADVLLSERPVRWLGISLLIGGVLLPFGLLYVRAANWEPAVPEVEQSTPLGIEMIILPTGSFMMGSPEDEPDRDDDEKLHEVTIDRRFAVSRTEITQKQYFGVMGERPVGDRKDAFDNACSEAGVGDDLPVVCIDWLEAVRFCNELSDREGLEPAYRIDGEDVTWNQQAEGYRLLTEAEWEYAARAGTRQRWVGAGDETGVCAYANVADATARLTNPGWTTFDCDDGFAALAPVGAMQPNRWLLHGLGGNAAEWVWDFYDSYPEGPAVDPTGPERASSRVIRGGSWGINPRSARVAIRSGSAPSYRYVNLGFRVARSLPSSL